jgi:hypothetical protein
MDVTVQIPDDLARRLRASGDDLSRRALEGFALEEYKRGKITKAELRRLLGFETRYDLDGFLKEHGVFVKYTVDDLRREVHTLERLGFWRVRLVIADTSPINYLLLIGHIDILPALFEKVILPAAVWEELKHPKAPAAVRNWVGNPPLWVEGVCDAEVVKDC